MGLGKTVTSVAVAMLCKLVTENVVIGLPLSISWGNNIEEWVILAHNDCPRIVSVEGEWYPLQRLNSCPASCWRSRQNNLTAIQHLYQP